MYIRRWCTTRLGIALAVLSIWSGVSLAQSPQQPVAQSPQPSAPQSAPESTPEQTFDIMEFRVLGNSVLQPIDIERAVYPFLGPHKTLKDVDGARSALESLYHDRGFKTVFVDIPEQSVDEGVVRLRASEGRLRQSRVSGARYFSERQIKAELPAAAAGTVPNLPELQQQLDAVNRESTDRTVVPILKAGPVPGTIDLNLKVDDHLPLHASAELNNQYTQDTAPLRAVFTLGYDNLFGDLDQAGLQYQTAPGHAGEVGVFAATYTSRPLFDGARVSGMFISSNSNVAAVGTLGVLGRGQIYSTRLTLPLELTSEVSQSLAAGVDYKHFQQTITVDPQTNLPSPVTYLNFSTTYTGDWRYPKHDFNVNGSLNFSPRSLVGQSDAFGNRRYLANPNYFYVRADASYTQQLPLGFRVITRLGGQYSAEPLISNENYSIAGSDGVRGYLEAQELGDQATKGSVQINTPELHWGMQQLGDLFVFFDEGWVGFVDSLPDEPNHVILQSAGLGFDLSPGHGFNASLTWAYPLVRDGRISAGDSRILFVVRGSF